MRTWRIAAISGVLAILLAGCAAAGAAPVDPVPTAPDLASPSTEEVTERYVNHEAKLSLALPQGWDSAGPFPVAVGSSTYNLYLLGPDPSTKAGPGASRLIVAADEALTVEAFLESQCFTCPPAELTTSNLNGIKVQRATLGSGGVPFVIEWIFLERDGRLTGLSIHDPDTLETLETVLETLQLN